MRIFQRAVASLAIALCALLHSMEASAAGAPVIRVAHIGHGIALHYVDVGHGTPIVFVHGSLTFGGYWADQIPEFAKKFRVIAYSRRYNYPNHNPARPGYSAITDADDLAALIHTLHLKHVIVVGHSYGAFAALFLAVRYPGLAKAIVLAEPPAVSLLRDLPPPEKAAAEGMYDDIQRRLVAPMKAAFRSGHRELGVQDFIDYVYRNPKEWASMSKGSRDETMRNAHEWDVMMTKGTLFPVITPAQVRSIHVPVLLLTGDKTYPFLTMIEDELMRLLPNRQLVVIRNAGHQMWYQAPELCRDVVETFIRWSGRTPSRPRSESALPLWRCRRAYPATALRCSFP